MPFPLFICHTVSRMFCNICTFLRSEYVGPLVFQGFFFSLIAFVGSIFIFSLKINNWDHPKGQATHTTLVMYLQSIELNARFCHVNDFCFVEFL